MASQVISEELDIKQVFPNPDQPRKVFDPEKLQELADSIKEVGQLTPIMVRPNGNGHVIIHGERRWRACQLAGLTTIRAEIKEANDNDAYTMSVIENEQRENLTPIETARSLKVLMETQSLTQSEVARRISKTRTWVAQKLRLLDLSQEVKELMANESITEGHARQLLKLQTAELNDRINTLATQAAEEEWSVARLQSEVDMVIIQKSNGVSRDTSTIDLFHSQPAIVPGNKQTKRVTVINHSNGQQFNLTGDRAQAVLDFIDSLMVSVSRDTLRGAQ